MSADFFSQLRRLVGVEQEVRQLQEKILQRPYDRDDPPEGAAVLLLRGLQTDLQSTKMESRRQLSSLCDDKGFMTLVPLCESLLQHQVAALSAVETHLSQYGYVAHPSKDTEDLASTDQEQNVPSTPGQSQGDNNGQPSMTPASTAKRPQFDLDRTPTLEDFGLSENHMAAILDRKNAVFKEPAPRSFDSGPITEPPSSLKKWSSADSIPDSFRHNMTIATTPGMFNGRNVPYVTPADHQGVPSCRLGSFNSPAAPTPKQRLLSSLNSEDSDSQTYREDLSSPIPPTFTTPGARQLPRKLPGRQPPPRPPTFSPSEDSGLDSPAPPTLTTPGVKQLYRPDRGLGVKIENRLGMESGETSTDNSPAYPTFNTPGLNKIHKPLSKDAASSEDNTPEQPQFCTPMFVERLQSKLTIPGPKQSERSSADTTPESPELTFAIKGDPLRANDVRDEPLPLKPRLTSRVSDEDDDMPGTPEMTFNFKSMTRSLHQVVPQVTKPTVVTATVTEVKAPEIKPEPIAPAAPPRSSCTDEDDDLPPEPEFTFNFTKQRTSRPEPPPTAPTLSHHTSTTTQQEPKPPKSNEVIPQEEEVPPGVPRLRPLKSEEYVSQPSWVQRQLSFDMVEKALDKLNALFVQKAKEGKALTISDRDMGSVSLTYFLMNTKRVVVHRETSLGNTYSVLQLP